MTKTEREHTFRALDRHTDGDISKSQTTFYWNYTVDMFSLTIEGPVTLYKQEYACNQSSVPLMCLCTSVSQPEKARKERKMRFTPEIDMPPCHACPCITVTLPQISCSVCELPDESGVVAPIADVLGEAAAVLSEGFRLSRETE